MAQLVLPHTIDAGTEIVAVEHQSNYVAIRDLINGNLEGGSGSDGNIKANGITARELADALLVKGVPSAAVQEGIVSDGDLQVTPGAGLVLNYAAGTAWITDDSGTLATGALLPATITASSVTVGTADGTNPRIDQIIVTLTGHNTGTVSVLAGTPTAGATLDNRNGAAALPSNAIRLADILVPISFVGPFVVDTHIRDRRAWATREQRYNVSAVSSLVIPVDSTVDSHLILSIEGAMSAHDNSILARYNKLTSARTHTYNRWTARSTPSHTEENARASANGHPLLHSPSGVAAGVSYFSSQVMVPLTTGINRMVRTEFSVVNSVGSGNQEMDVGHGVSVEGNVSLAMWAIQLVPTSGTFTARVHVQRIPQAAS